MTYSLAIDVQEAIQDTLDSVLGEMEQVIDNLTSYRREPAIHHEEVDIHDLLRQHQAIALIWDADMLLSTYPHLSKDQAWQVLQECERTYTAEQGLCWDDVGEVVTELFPDPAERLNDRVERCNQALEAYTDSDAVANLTDLLADARHWCDATEHDYSQLNHQAYQHYLAECHRKKG